jgi:hypothetical protein
MSCLPSDVVTNIGSDTQSTSQNTTRTDGKLRGKVQLQRNKRLRRPKVAGVAL